MRQWAEENKMRCGLLGDPMRLIVYGGGDCCPSFASRADAHEAKPFFAQRLGKYCMQHC